MSHKARKILTQDTFRALKELAELIPSGSILTIVTPQTVEPWELLDDPGYEDMMLRELDRRRTIGGEGQRQVDYAKWRWLEEGPFRRPHTVVVPATMYAAQAYEKLEFSGIIKVVTIPELNAFSHNGTWSTRHWKEIWGEIDVSILARHLQLGVNKKSNCQWYLEDALPVLLKSLVEFRAFERFERETPLTMILPPIYAQLFAWAFAEMHRQCRTKEEGRPATNDILNQPFYGCDAILVQPRGVSILRSGWEPRKLSSIRTR